MKQNKWPKKWLQAAASHNKAKRNKQQEMAFCKRLGLVIISATAKIADAQGPSGKGDYTDPNAYLIVWPFAIIFAAIGSLFGFYLLANEPFVQRLELLYRESSYPVQAEIFRNFTDTRNGPQQTTQRFYELGIQYETPSQTVRKYIEVSRKDYEEMTEDGFHQIELLVLEGFPLSGIQRSPNGIAHHLDWNNSLRGRGLFLFCLSFCGIPLAIALPVTLSVPITTPCILLMCFYLCVFPLCWWGIRICMRKQTDDTFRERTVERDASVVHYNNREGTTQSTTMELMDSLDPSNDVTTENSTPFRDEL
jgi:hypothetical protein